MTFVMLENGRYINLDLVEEFVFDEEEKCVLFKIGDRSGFSVQVENAEEFLDWLEEHKRAERRKLFEENKQELVKAVIEAMNKGAFTEKPRPALRVNKPDVK